MANPRPHSLPPASRAATELYARWIHAPGRYAGRMKRLAPNLPLQLAGALEEIERLTR